MQFASEEKLLINSKCEKKYVLKPFSKSLKLVPSTLQLIVLKILVLTFHLLGKIFWLWNFNIYLSKYESNKALIASYGTQYITLIKVLDPPISRHSTYGWILIRNPQHSAPYWATPFLVSGQLFFAFHHGQNPNGVPYCRISPFSSVYT